MPKQQWSGIMPNELRKLEIEPLARELYCLTYVNVLKQEVPSQFMTAQGINDLAECLSGWAITFAEIFYETLDSRL